MPLTATAVKNAKPKAKPYKMADQGGLHLLVTPSGGKLWRWKYRFHGKEKLLSIGSWPTISLAEARDHQKDARTKLKDGFDPSHQKKLEKLSLKQAAGNTFEAIAEEWLTFYKTSWTEEHKERVRSRFQRDVFPWLGNVAINAITAPELLAVVRRVEARGALYSAHRVMGSAGQVFRYAIATGRAERDPSQDLRGALPPTQTTHHASMTDPRKVAQLLNDLDHLEATFPVLCAARLLPLVFVRQGELRHAQWGEVDLDAAEWRIPASKMKRRVPHIVPLSKQAVEILKELQPLTDQGEDSYLFPSVRSAKNPMSENTINVALRRIGYSKEQMTGHGFRSIASTILHEKGWESALIERQLAHAEPNQVKASYNYAEHLPKRKGMMQWWADYLDELKAKA